MELKQIPTEKILASFTQPREHFDKEKIHELAESILSNGLINPIAVRVWKDKFMIVAGERRWRACKIAGLKKIDAFVKEYKDDGQFMIESLIENVHREDLSENERNKYLTRIKKTTGWDNNELAKKTGMNINAINTLFSIQETRKILPVRVNKEAKYGVIQETLSLEKEDRKKLIEKAVKNDIGQRQIREEVKVIKKSTPEVKKALLNDEISVEQAERITKLKTPEQRTKAIQEHKNIDLVSKGVERNVEHQETAKEKREIDKRLIQVKNTIASFRGCITESYSSIEKTIKMLIITTKFIPTMDENQREKFDEQLDRFLEILEKAEHLVKQVKEKI